MGPPLYLLDTGILLHLIRGNATGQHIDRSYSLRQQTFTPLVCIVTHGEILSLADQHGWQAAKRQVLEAMLANLVPVDINDEQVIDAYVLAERASLRHPPGAVRMGKNDLWIAAAARATGATLLTCDRDFDHLHPHYLDRVYVDPNQPGATP